ncbi:cobalt-precorrin-6A reductase [Acidocella sp.]|uniref:cobalt-precorrin-6A reductase n=1 Tax=Acidocella sp. TaxID=50710 RepID=UPI003D01D1E2
MQTQPPCVLLLGGTTEASRMARALAAAGIDAIFSYAGRTQTPVAQPLPTRIGGFGGVSGLAAYLRANAITHLIDATHPFAAQISRNAISACAETATALIALERPAWAPGPGDHWRNFPSLEHAAAALPEKPERIFLAIGKQNLDVFAHRPEPFYLLRLVDAPTAPLPFPNAAHVLDRGPFSLESDRALLRRHRITLVIAKNAGGDGARAKLDAARALHLPVFLIDRPALPARPIAATPEEVLRWLHHGAARGV